MKQRSLTVTTDKALKMIAGLKSVDPSLDFGNGLSLAALETLATTQQADIAGYNQQIAALDSTDTRIKNQEKDLRDLASRMLSAVAAHHGRDSAAYEAAGGTRMSERKRTGPRAEKKSTPTE
jgi:hypothetical protein